MRFLILGVVAVLALPGRGWAQRSANDLLYRAWYASDVVVASQQDKNVTVLETWKGNLAKGTVIAGLDLPAVPLEVSPSKRDDEEPRKTVSGNRVVLFLRHPQTEEAVPPPKAEWVGAVAWRPTKFSAVWIEDGQAYTLVERENRATDELRPVNLPDHDPSEQNLKRQSLKILAAKEALENARSIADVAKRVEALEHLATAPDWPNQSEAIGAMARCGPAAVPALEGMMQQYGNGTYQVASALARAAGAKSGPVMTVVLEQELAFWKLKLPRLPADWYDQPGDKWRRYRNRFEILAGELQS